MQGKVVAELTAMLQSGLPAARQLAACTLGDLAFFVPDIAEEINAVSSNSVSICHVPIESMGQVTSGPVDQLCAVTGLLDE